jgi:hypothetical protein
MTKRRARRTIAIEAGLTPVERDKVREFARRENANVDYLLAWAEDIGFAAFEEDVAKMKAFAAGHDLPDWQLLFYWDPPTEGRQ